MFKSKLVWISVGLPLLISLIFVYFILDNEPNLTLDPTITGFTNFYKWFAIPLYTAALSFPLLAIAISRFRSNQAELQIHLSKQQNTFVNYYKHHEEFEKRLNKLETQFEIEFKGKSGLYSLFFPENTPYNLDVNSRSNFIENIRVEFQTTISTLNAYCRKYIKADDLTVNQKCSVASIVLTELNLIRSKLNYEAKQPVKADFLPVLNQETALLSIKNGYEYNDVIIIDEILYDLCSFSFIRHERVTTEDKRPALKTLYQSVLILFASRAPGIITGSARWENTKAHVQGNRPDVEEYREFSEHFNDNNSI